MRLVRFAAFGISVVTLIPSAAAIGPAPAPAGEGRVGVAAELRRAATPHFLKLMAMSSVAHTVVRKALERQYQSWAHAAVTNDVDRILAILAPEYTLKTFAGKVITYDNYKKSLLARKAAGKPSTAYTTRICDLTVAPHAATVRSEEISISLAKDPILLKDVKIVHTHQYIDRWREQGRVWRLCSTVTTLEKTATE